MNISKIAENAKKEIDSANTPDLLESVRVKYLGRRGELTQVLRSLKDLPLKERKKIGFKANKLKDDLTFLITEKAQKLKTGGPKTKVDLTRPGERVVRGHLHPLTIIDREVQSIFRSLNFSVVDGPEVESEYYNFDALNIPQNHPARDMWDTFWIRNPDNLKLLLRTHTSPVQVRYMEKNNPPFQIIVPGRVFRYEATDASHEINFYQVEGLMVGKDITLANFKYIVEAFFKKLFGSNIKFRFRPSYFPFVEPGIEVDIKFSRGGWLEIMGAGMVHRNVFKAAGYNPENVQGFAFGVGMDRLAMIKYDIPDIRLFYSGDLRFIRQFR